MDVGDEEAGGNEYEEADEERGNVEQGYEGEVELYGCRVDVVAGGVEADDARLLLQHDETDADDVAPEQSATDDEDGKPQEGVADARVAHAQSFEDADGLGALEDDDEQSADHGDACHTDHEREDDPHVDIEQREPREDVGMGFVDGLRGKGLAIFVEPAVDVVDDPVGCSVQLCEVADCHLHTARLVLLPAVQPDGNGEVGEAERLVELCHIGLIDASHREAAGTEVVAKEIGKEAVAGLQPQLVGHEARDEQGIVGRAIGELRHVTLYEMFVEEREVVVAADAFEDNAEEVVVGLQDALYGRVACHTADTWCLAQLAHE